MGSDAQRVFSFAQVEAIRLRYPQEGGTKLAHEFGKTLGQIIHKAQKMGLRSTNWRQHQGAANKITNDTARMDFFDSWTHEMAYVLGYIWADGCIQANRSGKVYALRFLCTESDTQLLRDVASALGYAGPLRTVESHVWVAKHGRNPGRTYASKPTVQFSINSRHLAETLVHKHGLAPRKSSLNLPFPNVPEQYLSSFARGNFDGDGCVTHRIRKRKNGAPSHTGCVYWLGTPLWVIGLAERVAKIGLSKPSYEPQGDNLLRASWHNKSDIMTIREWLYASATLWLSRKRNAFDTLALSLEATKPHRRRRRSGTYGQAFVAEVLQRSGSTTTESGSR